MTRRNSQRINLGIRATERERKKWQYVLQTAESKHLSNIDVKVTKKEGEPLIAWIRHCLGGNFLQTLEGLLIRPWVFAEVPRRLLFLQLEHVEMTRPTDQTEWW